MIIKKAFKIFLGVAITLSIISWSNKENIIDFSSVKIGTQEWMMQNLEVSKYRNGDVIPQVQDSKAWSKLKTGAWCYSECNTENGKKYGKLYNWYAVNDKRGLAPKGWHIPTDNESLTLITFLVEMEAGKKMKTTEGWNDYHGQNGNGTNESGFTGLPGGNRGFDGKYANYGSNGEWWTSTEDGQKWAKAFYISWNDPRASREGYNKQNGCAVRCIKD